MQDGGWEDRGRGTVTLGDGRAVTVRRVSAYEMAMESCNLPTFVGGWDGYNERMAANERTKEDEKAACEYDQFFLRNGTVEPRIWPYHFDDTPPGSVHASSFSHDELLTILAKIMDLSGMGAAREASAFREGEGRASEPDGAAGGPGGEAVRDEPIGIPT